MPWRGARLDHDIVSRGQLVDVSARRGQMAGARRAGVRRAGAWWKDANRGAARGAEVFGRSLPGARSDTHQAVPDGEATRDWLALCWGPGGPGRAALRLVAWAHIAAGAVLVGAVLLLWSLGRVGGVPASATPGAPFGPLLLGGVGALLAMAGLVGLELARGAGGVHPLSRPLLPALDLVLAASALWVLGGGAASTDVAITAALVLTAMLAALLGDWRVGAAAVVLGVAAEVSTAVMRGAVSESGWWVSAAAVAAAGGLLVVALGTFQGLMARLVTALMVERAARDRDLAERVLAERRLRDGLRQGEEARMRLERERAATDREVARVVRYVRLLGEGEVEATGWLPAGLAREGTPSGPLAELAAHLERMRMRVAARHAPGPNTGPVVALLIRAAAEQARLLSLADADLRDQGAIANQLVRRLQRIAQSGELANGTADQRVAHETERLALAHASATAMLGARMAQLRARQSDLESQLRRLAATGTQARAGDLTGALKREGGTPPDPPRTLAARVGVPRG